MGHSADFFLGASGPEGFRSYFDRSFIAAEGWRVLIIKGGPGTGKSTLMKRICAEAEKRQLSYERIWCSSDPSSLDAVIVPELRRAIFDGTPPHTLEPKHPGVCENIIDLGAAWDERRLRTDGENIMRLSALCSGHHSQCTRYLACADAFRRNTLLLAEELLDTDKLGRMADRLTQRILKTARTAESVAGERTRLLSAVTPNGISFAGKPVCRRIIRIADNTGAAAGAILEQIRRRLAEAGEAMICCPCSQNGSLLEHIIVPDRDIMVTTCSDMHAAEADSRVIHAERFMDPHGLEAAKPRFAANGRARREMIGCAVNELRSALEVHNELEKCYKAAMDFKIADRIAEKAAGMFFAD